jgi:hypothetical protein
MKPYLELKIEGEGNDNQHCYTCNLKDNFSIYLENNHTRFQNFVSKFYFRNVEDIPKELKFNIKSSKVKNNSEIYKVTKEDLEILKTLNVYDVTNRLNIIFEVVYLHIKELYIKSEMYSFNLTELNWVDVFHSTSMCPIPGIFIQYIEFE